MIDHIALAIGHGLLAVALLRLVLRASVRRALRAFDSIVERNGRLPADATPAKTAVAARKPRG